MLINQGILQNLLRWNDNDCWYSFQEKRPYLRYDIIVECKNLNPVKLSKKQLNLYSKICELKDKGLTYKQISNKLNELGYEPTRGEKGEFTPQKVWSNYTKIKKNQERKVERTNLNIKDLKIIWK